MYVKLPDGSEAWCRKCTCTGNQPDHKLGGHVLTCHFYQDFSKALTDFVYSDDEPSPPPDITKLN